MIHGFTSWNFSMKPSISTTRSRTTGKFERLDHDGVAVVADRRVLQVSFGSPFTIIPQLPHTAMRQDQR